MTVTSSRFSLNEASIGSVVRITELTTQAPLRQKLIDLGLVPGAQITVLDQHEGTLLSVGSVRYALGRPAAAHIHVEPVHR